MIPATTERVRAHTHDEINAAIEAETDWRVGLLADDPEGIELRLEELDEEWDVERTLEANAATLAFVGTALGAGHDRRWLALPLAVTGFLWQHAVQGWCPPLPVLRRMGFRTASEIETERAALKALRGDYAITVPPGPDRAMRALAAARA